jgi:uncharacterized protein YbaR (Trm112 family)
MFIELLDGLRCVADHAQIPLVAAILERDERFVMRGILGCPTCRREYQITDGMAWFREQSNSGQARESMAKSSPRDGEGAVRIGAFLAVADGATVALVGDWARYAIELSELVGLRAYAVNPCEPIGESERVGVLYADYRLPVTDGSLRGVAVDESGWSEGDLQLAARALSPGGRMVAPATSPVPVGMEEIARDDRWWIGEKRGPLVTLHRR